MNISRIMAVASAAVFIALTAAAPASASRKTDEKNKSELKKENIRLRSELDSLKAELDKYREERHRTDSLTNALLN